MTAILACLLLLSGCGDGSTQEGSFPDPDAAVLADAADNAEAGSQPTDSVEGSDCAYESPYVVALTGCIGDFSVLAPEIARPSQGGQFQPITPSPNGPVFTEAANALLEESASVSEVPFIDGFTEAANALLEESASVSEVPYIDGFTEAANALLDEMDLQRDGEREVPFITGFSEAANVLLEEMQVPSLAAGEDRAAP